MDDKSNHIGLNNSNEKELSTKLNDILESANKENAGKDIEKGWKFFGVAGSTNSSPLVNLIQRCMQQGRLLKLIYSDGTAIKGEFVNAMSYTLILRYQVVKTDNLIEVHYKEKCKYELPKKRTEHCHGTTIIPDFNWWQNAKYELNNLELRIEKKEFEETHEFVFRAIYSGIIESVRYFKGKNIPNSFDYKTIHDCIDRNYRPKGDMGVIIVKGLNILKKIKPNGHALDKYSVVVLDFLNFIVGFLPKDSGLDMIESNNKRKINNSWTGS